MDAFATIPVEIQATFAAALVVGLVFALQILDLRRAKRASNLKLQELANALTKGETLDVSCKICPVSVWSLILQFTFGIIVFSLLSCWALFLFKQGLIGTGLCSAIFALIGIGTPIYVWLCGRQEAKKVQQLISGFNRPAAADTVAEIKPSVAHSPEVKEEAPAKTNPASSVAPVVAEVKSAPVTKVIEVESLKKAVYVQSLPEDSMLRRHYLTHLQSKSGTVSERPTDSMLRRHFDTHRASLRQAATKPEETSKMAAAPAVTTIIKAAEKASQVQVCSSKPGLPQDSILRRHYLSAIRAKIETSLPPCPTDSILKRHFEGWKNYYIDCEMSKHLRESGA